MCKGILERECERGERQKAHFYLRARNLTRICYFPCHRSCFMALLYHCCLLFSSPGGRIENGEPFPFLLRGHLSVYPSCSFSNSCDGEIGRGGVRGARARMDGGWLHSRGRMSLHTNLGRRRKRHLDYLRLESPERIETMYVYSIVRYIGYPKSRLCLNVWRPLWRGRRRRKAQWNIDKTFPPSLSLPASHNNLLRKLPVESISLEWGRRKI